MAFNNDTSALDQRLAPGAEQARQDVMVDVTVAMTMIGVTCAGLLLYTRAFIARNLRIEDWTMISAATLTLVYLFEIIAASKEFKSGFSASSLTLSEIESTLKITIAIIIVYKTAMTLIKISILLIYLRHAFTKTFKGLCKGTICVLIAYNFIIVIVVSSQCRPLRKLWDFTGQVEGTCINANAFNLITSAFHIIMDIWILVLPYRIIISVPRSTREKLALVSIFGLGVFSITASIIRFYYLHRFTQSSDPLYDSLPINIWSMIEANMGILCASLPVLKPLISKAERDRTRGTLDYNQEDEIWIKQISPSSSLSSSKSAKSVRFDEEYELDDRPPPVPSKDFEFKLKGSRL